jgi:hypothetical protein
VAQNFGARRRATLRQEEPKKKKSPGKMMSIPKEYDQEEEEWVCDNKTDEAK